MTHDEILLKAAWLLSEFQCDAHALPLMGTDMEWFRQTLACLVELAVPGIALSAEGGDFLRDVRDGIEQSLGDLDG